MYIAQDQYGVKVPRIYEKWSLTLLTRLCHGCRMNKQPVYLTTSQVAHRFCVDSSVVRRWVLKGKLHPDITTPGGHHRFLEATVEAAADAARRK